MKYTCIALSTLILIIYSCTEKKHIDPKTISLIKQDFKIEPFSPPSDSQITSNTLKTWMTCNPLLDSLAVSYGDSFKTEDASKRLRYQDDFSKAQDQICALSGLKGGYKEYRWIMENMGNPRNKEVLNLVNAAVK